MVLLSLIKSFFNIVSWCCLLISFANSLEPDQAGYNVGPDLGPNCLILIVFLKCFLEKDSFERKMVR